MGTRSKDAPRVRIFPTEAQYQYAAMSALASAEEQGCETVALLGGLTGEPSSPAVRLWLEFADGPTGRHWYRAHNASIVAGYLEHRDLAAAESAPERFFMNVALARVLYAHALAGAAAPGARTVRPARPPARRASQASAGGPARAAPRA